MTGQESVYRLQFGPEDIVRKFREVHVLDEDSKKVILARIFHSLRSTLTSIVGNTSILSGSIDKRRPSFENKLQRAYAECIFYKTGSIRENLDELYNIIHAEDFSGEIDPKRANTICTQLIDYLSYFPTEEQFRKVGEVTQRQMKYVPTIDLHALVYVFGLNRTFGENHQGPFFLKKDLEFFTAKIWSERKKAGYGLSRNVIKDIQTKEDYLNEVIIPLINNAIEHAYNPDNDTSNRLVEEEFKKKIIIHGPIGYEVVDGRIKIPQSGEYKVSISDNGFGMQPEIYKKLFQKATTSKPDDGTEHGIGVWGAHEVVTRNGGRMWCETELGKGTTFYFTIPYDKIIASVCIQKAIK